MSAEERIKGASEFWRSKTHCPQGHPYDEVNTVVRANGHRQCRICRNEYSSLAHAKRQAAKQTVSQPVDTQWFERAACKGLNPDMFHPKRGGSTTQAKAVCAVCPVQPDCLEYALVTGERFGIWGGVTEKQRKRMRVARQRAAGKYHVRRDRSLEEVAS